MTKKAIRQLAPDEATPFEARAEQERKAYGQWRSCTSKQRAFDDQLVALRVAEPIGLRVYKCKYCNRWHMASRVAEDREN